MATAPVYALAVATAMVLRGVRGQIPHLERGRAGGVGDGAKPGAALKTRLIVLASGEGRAEDLAESWRMANTLGAQGIPNRVDPWGPEWHHDWPTWREMLPKYVGDWVKE